MKFKPKISTVLLLIMSLFIAWYLHASYLHEGSANAIVSSLSHLKEINQAIRNYQHDHNGALPDLRDAQHLSQCLYPRYIAFTDYNFVSSVNHEWYRINVTAYKSPNKIHSPKDKVALIYDTTETRQSTQFGNEEVGRCVLSLDGKARWINHEKWLTFQK